MNSTMYCIRVDKKLKHQFDSICKEFGLTPSAVFNVYAKKVVREKRIPFVIESSNTTSYLIDEKVSTPSKKKTTKITKVTKTTKTTKAKKTKKSNRKPKDQFLDDFNRYIEKTGQFIVREDTEEDPEQLL